MVRRDVSTERPQLTVLEDRISPSSFGLDSALESGLKELAAYGPALVSNAAFSQHGSQGNQLLASSFMEANTENHLNILPIQSHSHGSSYGEWSADWWQWAFSMPYDSNNLLDTAPANAHQSGNVWYIGGSFTNVQTETRQLTMPVGTSLFFPVVNVEVDNIGGAPTGAPYQGSNLSDSQLRADAVWAMDQALAAQTPFAKIDGVAVPDLLQYRVESPAFTLTLPENNLYQYFGVNAPAGTTSHAVSDGIYLMLPPLSAGQHTIEIGATLPSNNGGQPSFAFDITYQINVTPGHHS